MLTRDDAVWRSPSSPDPYAVNRAAMRFEPDSA
jgi:hypothetical protein